MGDSVLREEEAPCYPPLTASAGGGNKVTRDLWVRLLTRVREQSQTEGASVGVS